jgi:hypothetical protein
MEDLTQSGNVGVRWQAQMEEHLDRVRKFTMEACSVPGEAPAAMVRANLAQAHAVAALALSLANGLGDLEQPVGKIAESIEDIAKNGLGSIPE